MAEARVSDAQGTAACGVRCRRRLTQTSHSAQMMQDLGMTSMGNMLRYLDKDRRVFT